MLKENWGALDVHPESPLPLINGYHRNSAMEAILTAAERQAEKGKTAKERQEGKKLAERVLAQPITLMVLLDGETQRDFIKLQLGRTIDRSHLLALKVRQDLMPEKDATPMKVAFHVANTLAGSSKAPFFKQIRFDSDGSHHYNIATLCTKGSEASGSLFGLARVGLAFGKGYVSEKLSGCVTAVANAIKKRAPELTEYGMTLRLPPEANRGNTFMLLGLAILLYYRARFQDRETPSEADLDRLIHCVRHGLSSPIEWNQSKEKRSRLGDFAEFFLEDLDCDKHEGIPLELLKVLPPSAYGRSPVPKAARQKKAAAAKPRNKKSAVEHHASGLASNVDVPPRDEMADVPPEMMEQVSNVDDADPAEAFDISDTYADDTAATTPCDADEAEVLSDTDTDLPDPAPVGTSSSPTASYRELVGRRHEEVRVELPLLEMPDVVEITDMPQPAEDDERVRKLLQAGGHLQLHVEVVAELLLGEHADVQLKRGPGTGMIRLPTGLRLSIKEGGSALHQLVRIRDTLGGNYIDIINQLPVTIRIQIHDVGHGQVVTKRLVAA